MLLALVVAMAAFAQSPNSASWQKGQNVAADLGLGDVDPSGPWTMMSNAGQSGANGKSGEPGDYGKYWQGVGQKFFFDYIDNTATMYGDHEAGNTCAGFYSDGKVVDDNPDLYQVVKFPAGHYTIRVQAVYRDGNGDDVERTLVPNALKGKDLKNTWVYANVLPSEDPEAEPTAQFTAQVKHLAASILTENQCDWSPNGDSWRNDRSFDKDSGEEDDFGDPIINTYYYPASIIGASYHFKNGNFWNEFDILVTEDSYVRLGIMQTVVPTSGWMAFSEWQVIYNGAPTADAMKTLYNNEKKAFNNKIKKVEKETKFTGFDKNLLTNIAGFMAEELDGIDGRFKSASTVDAQVALFTELQELGRYYDDTYDLLEQLSYVLTKSNGLIEKAEYPVDNFKAAYEDLTAELASDEVYDAFDEGTRPYEYITEVFNKIVEARGDYLNEQEAQENGSKDFSQVINHPWMVNDGEEPTLQEDGTWKYAGDGADEIKSDVQLITNSTSVKNEWYEDAMYENEHITGAVLEKHGNLFGMGEGWHGSGGTFAGGYEGICQNVMGLPDGFYSLKGLVYTGSVKGKNYNNIFLENNQGDKEMSNLATTSDAWEEVETGIIEVSDKQLRIGGMSDGYAWYTGFRLYFWGKVPPAKNMIAEKIEQVKAAEANLTAEDGSYAEFAGDKKYIQELIAKVDLSKFEGLEGEAVVPLYREYKGYLDDASKYIATALKEYKNLKAKATYETINTENENMNNAADVAAIVLPAQENVEALGTDEADTYEKIADANKLADKYAEYIKKYQEAYNFNDDNVNTILADQKTNLAKKVATINTLDYCIQKLVLPINMAKMKELGAASATESNPVDVTSMLVNPSFDLHQVNGEWVEVAKQDGEIWERGYSDGWQGIGINTYENTMQLSRGHCEIWNSDTGEFYQEFAGMPAGTYEITCLAAYRDCDDLDAEHVEAYDAAGEENWENHNVVLFARTSANGETVTESTDYVKAAESLKGTDFSFTEVIRGYSSDDDGLYATQVTVLGDEEDTDKYDYAEIQFTHVDPANAEMVKDINPFDVKIGEYYYPNSMYGFYMWFQKEPAKVTSKVHIKVNQGETLRLGLRKDVKIENDCLTFDDFQIKYLTGDVFQEAVTGIEEVAPAKAANAGVLYNTAGQIVDKSYKGIVIDSEGKKFIQK